MTSSYVSPSQNNFDEVFSLLDELSIQGKKNTAKGKRRSAGDPPPPTFDEIAALVSTQCLRLYAERMEQFHVSLDIDRKGLPFYGEEQLNLAVRPPANQQRIMVNKNNDHFVGVYSLGQANQLKAQGYRELEGLFVPDSSISTAFIAAIPSKLQAAREAASRQTEAADDSNNNSITGRLPAPPLPEDWWTHWYEGSKKSCADFIKMWEGGAVLSVTSAAGVTRTYTLPPPKTHEEELKALNAKKWHCGNRTYTNLTTMAEFKVAGSLDRVLPYSRLRDKLFA